MEYLKIDPRLDEHPEIIAAGFVGSQVFQAILRAIGNFDKRGTLPKKFGAQWLARRLNLRSEDVGCDPEKWISSGINKAVEAGLIVLAGGDLFVPGWERFYTAPATSAERMQRHREKLRQQTNPDGAPRVYLLENPRTGLVKIGFSENAGSRLMQLRTDHGGPLNLLGLLQGGRALEAQLHEQFANLRREGEWFEPGEELLAFIEENGMATPSSRDAQNARDARDSTPLHFTSQKEEESEPKPEAKVFELRSAPAQKEKAASRQELFATWFETQRHEALGDDWVPDKKLSHARINKELQWITELDSSLVVEAVGLYLSDPRRKKQDPPCQLLWFAHDNAEYLSRAKRGAT